MGMIKTGAMEESVNPVHIEREKKKERKRKEIDI